jgi:protein gp37
MFVSLLKRVLKKLHIVCDDWRNTEWFSVQDCVIYMHEGCHETFRKRKSRRLKCMDHAILLGKPFGHCFMKVTTMKQMTF